MFPVNLPVFLSSAPLIIPHQTRVRNSFFTGNMARIDYMSDNQNWNTFGKQMEGALVSIMDGEGRRLYEMTTDENGQTQAAALETVNKSYSLSPYYPRRPYTGYQVLALLILKSIQSLYYMKGAQKRE